MEDYSNDIYIQINHEYANIRRQNKEKHEAMVKSILSAIPRIGDIQKELSDLGINATKELLSGVSGDDIIYKMKTEMERLQKEKISLLTSFGLPEDALDELYTCQKCKDTGITDHGRCECFKEKLSNTVIKMSNVGTSGNHTFKNFDTSLFSNTVIAKYGMSPREAMEAVLEKAKAYARDEKGSPNNLLFFGNNGLGKTFTSDCIANEYMNCGKTVFYMSAPKLFTLFEDYKFGRDTSQNARLSMNAVFDANLLIIDDLGTEFKTLYVESILFEIINSRLNNNLKTIISTNLFPQQFAEKYNNQISSRIIGCYEKLFFIGDDIRVKKR